MKYTVKPAVVEGCECPDCLAGRHLFSLFRWTEAGWRWAATSLQTYPGAEECKAKHPWMIAFGPEDTWEDGSPLVDPEPILTQRSNVPADAAGMVPLDMEALRKSADLLEKHWRPGRE